jgi:SAM-dependent methyltransferase
MGEMMSEKVPYGALANPQLHSVLKKFGPIAFKRCSVMMEFEAFLKRVLAGRKLGTCLEIGTFNGISAIVLAQYFERVVCVSVDDRPRELLKQRIVEHLGITNVEFFDCTSNEEKAGIVKGLDFDFCYQDGDHKNDTFTDFDLVQRCGRVLFHEVWEIQPAVCELVRSLPDDEITMAHFDCLAYWERKAV